MKGAAPECRGLLGGKRIPGRFRRASLADGRQALEEEGIKLQSIIGVYAKATSIHNSSEFQFLYSIGITAIVEDRTHYFFVLLNRVCFSDPRSS